MKVATAGTLGMLSAERTTTAEGLKRQVEHQGTPTTSTNYATSPEPMETPLIEGMLTTLGASAIAGTPTEGTPTTAGMPEVVETPEAESKEKHGVWEPMPELTITSPYSIPGSTPTRLP